MRFTTPYLHPYIYYDIIRIPALQNTKGKPIDLETIQTATPAQRRHPSSPAATAHRKSHGFVLRLPPQFKAHITFMQPLQCLLRYLVPIHAAITMRFTSPHHKTPRDNRLTSKRSKPQTPHTGSTVPFIAACNHFTRKYTRLRAPTQNIPKPAACNINAAITMHFATPNTHLRSHYHAIYIHSCRTTDWPRNNPNRALKSPKSLTFLGIFGPTDLYALARCHPYRNISSNNVWFFFGFGFRI